MKLKRAVQVVKKASLLSRVVCLSHHSRPENGTTDRYASIKTFPLVAFVDREGVKKGGSEHQHVELVTTPGMKMSRATFVKSKKQLAHFDIDVESVEKGAPKRLNLQSKKCIAMNGALALKDGAKKLEIHKSTVVWTPITKDRKVVGFQMTYPGMYKKFKAFFGAEVVDDKRMKFASFRHKFSAMRRASSRRSERRSTVPPGLSLAGQKAGSRKLHVPKPSYMVSTKASTSRHVSKDPLHSPRKDRRVSVLASCITRVTKAFTVRTSLRVSSAGKPPLRPRSSSHAIEVKKIRSGTVDSDHSDHAVSAVPLTESDRDNYLKQMRGRKTHRSAV